MGGHVKVTQGGLAGRGLDFVEAAAYQPNIYGYPMFGKVVYFEHFLGKATDETNDIAVNESHGGLGAKSAGQGGRYTLTTGGANADKGEAALALDWYSSAACAMEAKIKVDAITTVGLVVGLVDAASYSNDQVAFEISGVTIVDRCSNGAAWVFDTDANAAYWHYCNSKATNEAGTSVAIAPVADTYERFRVMLDTLGNATFYRNGVAKGYKALAITTTTALTPYVAVIARAAAVRVATIDYIWAWQNEA